MKRLAFVLVCLFFSVSVWAGSPVNLGIKGGSNSSKIITNLDQFNEESINNYFLGAFVRMNIGRFYIQPEAYYNTKGGRLEYTNALDTYDSFDFKSVDVPLLAGIKLIKGEVFNFRVMGGPTFTFVTDKKISGDTFSKDNLRDDFIGWQYGAGIDFLFLTFDARFESSRDIYSGAVSPDTKNQVFLLSLGIKFL